MLPLLVGLGVDELSVGAAGSARSARWIRRSAPPRRLGLARSALTMDSDAEVQFGLSPSDFTYAGACRAAIRAALDRAASVSTARRRVVALGA